MAAKKKSAKRPSAASIKKAANQLKDIINVQKKLALDIQKHKKYMLVEFDYGFVKPKR